MCLLTASAPGIAAAQAGTPSSTSTEAARATIVRIDGQDVFLDVGAGVVRGEQALTVYRSIVVRHPVSGVSLRDRFAIGSLVVRQAGTALSLARAASEPERAFQVGDIAEAPQAVAQVTTPAATATTTTAAATPAGVSTSETTAATTAATAAPDRETDELLRYWQATLGKAPKQRAAYYRGFLARWPASRYRDALNAEIIYLLQTRPASRTAPAPEAPKPDVVLAKLELARSGEPIDLAASYDVAHAPHRLVAFVRQRGQAEYDAVPMTLDGRGHATARVDAKKVRPPELQYFVESVAADGTATPVAGRAAEPHEVQVLLEGDEPEDDGPRTHVRFSSELVSFEGASGDDYFLINEGDFFHRLELGVLHGVRMGYGHFLGEGGKLDAEGKHVVEPDAAGFSYGFFETELSLSRLVGAAGRITLGLGRPEDVAERDGITGGFQARLRIGTAEGTRLVLAGEVLPELGQRAFIGLVWQLIERVPMSTEVHVTDQPVNSDELAVRIVQELGYRFGDRFALALRPSYQLRTIKHAGPGIGLAATFDW